MCFSNTELLHTQVGNPGPSGGGQSRVHQEGQSSDCNYPMGLAEGECLPSE